MNTLAVFVLAIAVLIGCALIVFRRTRADRAASDRTYIPAGCDLLETAEEGAEFRFDKIPIPAGFFAPRASSFNKKVVFRGRSLPSRLFQGVDITHVDTVIERTQPAALPPPYPSTARVPLEIAGLALEAVEPIEIEIGDRSELWNVEADLSPVKPSTGQMTLTKRDEHGGTFDSELTVFPRFRFIRVYDGKEKVLDTGALPFDQKTLQMLMMRSKDTPWRHEAPRTLQLAGLNDNFIAGAPGLFREDGESCAHPVEEAPDCKVVILAQSRCVCVGRRRPFTGKGSPAGGNYTWSISQGASRARISGPSTNKNVDVEATLASSVARDVRLQVVYTPPGGGSCTASIAITSVDATLTLHTMGTWDPDNQITQDPRMGVPRLGEITPGNPAGALGFFQNIEIEARIRPNAPNLGCQFDFKRTRQGVEGLLVPGGAFMEGTLHCPGGGCDDDGSNADEDLSLSANGAIFDADTPGFFLADAQCTQQVQGAIRLSCLNFRNWLEVDGQRCGNEILWHAHTRVRCNNGAWEQQASQVGAGHISCTVATPVLPGAGFNAMEVARQLESPSLGDRASAFARARAAVSSLDGDERARLVQSLMRTAEGESDAAASPPALAIQLLGLLRAEEAISLLVSRVLEDFGHPMAAVFPTPGAAALRQLGDAVLSPILERADAVTDEQWSMLERVIRSLEQQEEVRRKVCSLLDAEPGQPAEQRLAAVLKSRGTSSGRRRSAPI